MIRIDQLWLAVDRVDLRAGGERLMNQVMQRFGQVQAHHGYLFTNQRGSRLKLLVCDGFGVWCATRSLHEGRFIWPTGAGGQTASLALKAEQFDALVVGLPWQRLAQNSASKTW
jgi:transposase